MKNINFFLSERFRATSKNKGKILIFIVTINTHLNAKILILKTILPKKYLIILPHWKKTRKLKVEIALILIFVPIIQVY